MHRHGDAVAGFGLVVQVGSAAHGDLPGGCVDGEGGIILPRQAIDQRIATVRVRRRHRPTDVLPGSGVLRHRAGRGGRRELRRPIGGRSRGHTAGGRAEAAAIQRAYAESMLDPTVQLVHGVRDHAGPASAHTRPAAGGERVGRAGAGAADGRRRPHDHGVSFNRYRSPEHITPSAVGRRQLGCLGGGRPSRRGLHEHVGGAGAGAVVVVVVRPDHHGVPARCHGYPEFVIRSAVGRRQLGRLGGGRPSRRGPHEHVGRAGAGAVVVIQMRPHDQGVPVNRYRSPELVRITAVGRRQLGRLGGVRPSRGGLHEHVGRAGGAAVDKVPTRPRGHRVPIHRDRPSELIPTNAVRRRQLGCLGGARPSRGGPHENIGRAGTGAAVVVPSRPHHHRVPVHRYRPPEVIAPSAVGRRQLGRLGGARPSRGGPDEYVGRAGTGAAVVVPFRPHHHGGPVHRYRVPELVTQKAVGRRQLGNLPGL